MKDDDHNNRPHIHHNSTTPPTIIPASLKICTLLPELAIRPKRPALVLREEEKFEKTSFCSRSQAVAVSREQRYNVDAKVEGGANRTVDELLATCIVVDVYGDTAESRDFGREFVKAGVVLPGQGVSLGAEYGKAMMKWELCMLDLSLSYASDMVMALYSEEETRT